MLYPTKYMSVFSAFLHLLLNTHYNLCHFIQTTFQTAETFCHGQEYVKFKALLGTCKGRAYSRIITDQELNTCVVQRVTIG